jgi:hypothetical protein
VRAAGEDLQIYCGSAESCVINGAGLNETAERRRLA